MQYGKICIACFNSVKDTQELDGPTAVTFSSNIVE
jgi:hypothetical protein